MSRPVISSQGFYMSTERFQTIPNRSVETQQLINKLKDGKPTWTQKLVVAIYVYFIPALFVLNMVFLFRRWTAVPWVL